MLLTALIHGGLWINNRLRYGLPIIGQKKETSGIVALTLIGIIVLSSLKSVRTRVYGLFFTVQ